MELKKTGFYDIHVALQAKMVPFAGYIMPIQYTSIIDEHKLVRTQAGLFDVSHMGEFIVRGKDAEAFLQKLTVNDVSALQVNQVQYSAMCYDDGGIVDDLLVYRFEDHYMMIVNAANLDKDWQWSQDHLFGDVKMENISDDMSLLALQGPAADAILAKLTDLPLAEIPFYWTLPGKVDGVEMIVSRTGYTGEPGFELCFPVKYSEQIWNALMKAGKAEGLGPVGLGARDTLRMEMKYCLYGNDIDKTTHPLEAGLGWITKLEAGDFIGRDAILKAREQGLTRRLVGFEMTDKAFPRHDYKIVAEGKEIGHVTSGTFSPMLEKGIGIGYVKKSHAGLGSKIKVLIRNKELEATVVKTPFYHHS